MYKKYGQTFKQIRKQGGFSQACFSSVGISKSTLSAFESGKAMMGFEKVNTALQMMGIGLGEFEHLLNHYVPNDCIILLQEAENATLCGDKKKLESLAESARQANFTHIAFTFQVLSERAGTFEKDELTDFLYTATVWSYKEMFIFYSLINQLVPKDIINILENFEKVAKGMYHSPEYNRALVLVLCRAITTLSYYGYEAKSKELINVLEQEDILYSMFLKNLFYGTKAYWVYCFKDREQGKEMADKFLEIQELLGEPHVTKYYKDRLRRYMKDD